MTPASSGSSGTSSHAAGRPRDPGGPVPGLWPDRITVLDAQRFLEDAIRSVFAQTYASWELLLVDDGSSDRSTDIARAWCTAHPSQARCLEHEGRANRGM